MTPATNVYVHLDDPVDHLMVAHRLAKHGWAIDFYQVRPNRDGYHLLNDKDATKIWQGLGFQKENIPSAVSTDILIALCQKQMAGNPNQQVRDIGSWTHFMNAQEDIERLAALIPVPYRL